MENDILNDKNIDSLFKLVNSIRRFDQEEKIYKMPIRTEDALRKVVLKHGNKEKSNVYVNYLDKISKRKRNQVYIENIAKKAYDIEKVKEIFDEKIENYSIIFSEVYEILKVIDRNKVMKIPKNILNSIVGKRDKEYIFDIENAFKLASFRDETINFLGWLNIEFWAETEEKKNELRKIYAVMYRDRYNRFPDDGFDYDRLFVDEHNKIVVVKEKNKRHKKWKM